jgi:hypothetical protein
MEAIAQGMADANGSVSDSPRLLRHSLSGLLRAEAKCKGRPWVDSLRETGGAERERRVTEWRSDAIPSHNGYDRHFCGLFSSELELRGSPHYPQINW